jgi:response regulator of citrate/malate metabolism
VDYLLKPFDDERFAKAIARARALFEKERGGEEEAVRIPDEMRRGDAPAQRLRDQLVGPWPI